VSHVNHAIDIELIHGAEAAAAALHPLRRQILEQLRETDSAAGVARALRLPRQRVTYHVRELERQGLVEAVGERKRGNCVERLVRSTARSYLIAPQVLGDVGAVEGVRDQFSSSYLLAVAAQTIRDVAEMRKGADRTRLKLATLSLQAEVRFASPAAQHEFAEELASSVAHVVSKYHDEHSPGGRVFRFNLLGYPRPVRAAEDETRAGEST
jgi:DNA-binding transcriptional ArsR family regulator